MNDQSQASYLTDTSFWNDFWGDITLPALVDTKVQWYLALTNTFRRHLPYGANTLKLMEIGCAPGRWLVWFNQAMSYQVTGCDSSDHGVHLTQENLRLNNVEGQVYYADMFSSILPERTFDVVLSIGLIEHFDHPYPVIRRHLELLKPGGYLVLSVPNMAGYLNYRLLRMAGMDRLLSVHNLDVMQRLFFQEIARKFHLQIEFLDYIGGFDPGLIIYNYHHDYQYPDSLTRLSGMYGKVRKLLYVLLKRKHVVIPLLSATERLFRMHPYPFTRFNASWCSHILLGIFRSPLPL